MLAPWRASESATPRPMPLVEPVTRAHFPLSMDRSSRLIQCIIEERRQKPLAMNDARLNFVQCLDSRGLHRMAYWEWGDAANPKVLVCAHGLSRQGRDFESLALALQSDYRVVAPDVVGRGRSDWLTDPMGYQLPAYVADMVTLLARLNSQTVHWVGTSMGGLIGLGLASLPGSPIRRLVLNDVGPSIPFDALERIGAYLGLPIRWASVEEAA